jgi:hypothetical protein
MGDHLGSVLDGIDAKRRLGGVAGVTMHMRFASDLPFVTRHDAHHRRFANDA